MKGIIAVSALLIDILFAGCVRWPQKGPKARGAGSGQRPGPASARAGHSAARTPQEKPAHEWQITATAISLDILKEAPSLLALQGAGRARKNLAGSLGVRVSSTGHQG